MRKKSGKISLFILLGALALLMTGCKGRQTSEPEKFSEAAGESLLPQDNGQRMNVDDRETASGKEEQNSEERQNLKDTENLMEDEKPEDINFAGQVQKTASGALVQLRAGNLYGSGVILQMEESVLVVTAGHVVQGADQAEVVFADGSSVVCGDIEVSKSADAAFLKIDAEALEQSALDICCAAVVDKSSYDSLSAGDVMIVMGSVDGAAANAYEGEVVEPWIYMEDFGQYMMLGRTYATPGMSGGGVFDSRGRLIGILCGEAEASREEVYKEIAVLPLAVILSESGI